MSTPTFAESAARFIASRLVKKAEVRPGMVANAIAETAERFNDSSWFWTDDNAKVAELLCSPAIRDRHATLAEETLDFVLRMSPGDIIHRRSSAAELEVVSADPRSFHVRNAFCSLHGDLSRGLIQPSARFNDGRGEDVVHHMLAAVTFRFRHRMRLVRPSDAILDYGIEAHPDHVELSFSARIAVRPLLRAPGGPDTEIGTVRCSFLVWKSRSTVTMRAALTVREGIRVRDVALLTAFDRCGDRISIESYATVSPDGRRRIGQLDGRGKRVIHEGPLSYLALRQEGHSPGFSYAAHVRLRDGDRLRTLTTHSFVPGRLHRLVLRYAAPADGNGSFAVEEERLLTSGGYYDDLDHYMNRVDAASDEGVDPSMTYDIGAELNAVATCYLFGVTGQYRVDPPPPARLAALRAWYDRHLDRYFAVLRPGDPGEGGRTFIRGLAFTLLSLDCMVRATGEERYRAAMESGLSSLLRRFNRVSSGTELHEGLFLDAQTQDSPFLDVHAAATLALARCSRHGDPTGSHGRTLAEAVMAVKLSTPTWAPGPDLVVTFDSLSVKARPGTTHYPAEDPGYWNFKLGLTLRALGAVRRAHEAGAVALPPRVAERVAVLQGLARTFLLPSCREGPDGVEVLTSHRSGETNSETQPWVALGLDPALDEAVEGTWPGRRDG